MFGTFQSEIGSEIAKNSDLTDNDSVLTTLSEMIPQLWKSEKYAKIAGNNIDGYGKENISIVIDKFRKTFPIQREQIKQKAIDAFTNAKIIDAYMYEGKEGIKIIFNDKDRSHIEILPGSFHLWIKIDKNVENFCNWLLENIYSNR